MSEIALTTLVGSAGFALGAVFGWAARASDFCTMGALSDLVFLGDRRRLRAWVLAMAVAMLGAQGLQAAGLVELGKSIYLGATIAWAGAILGGLMFGYGMTLAGGCGSKTLVRLGGGNLKSVVVVLVVGLFATMTLKGLLAMERIAIEQATGITAARLGASDQSLPALLAGLGLPHAAARILTLAVLGGGALVWCLKDASFRAAGGTLAGAVVIGLTIPTGWAVTAILGADDFAPAPIASLSFISPMGDGLMYLMTFTGSTISFGVAAVGGIIAGSFLSARLSGRFAWEGFADTADLRRHLGGAALMGTGGIMAMGCTIGQGLTGLSTLSATSFLALGAIISGGLLGLRSLEEGGLLPGLKSLLKP
ncbi:Lipocalin-related protein and Bos/Can/Equ allergen [Paramagnetospirillum magnetotacticum MS-1]|uniref:Lipocalin-related protein and Bos/Can/Equ allergen n=1 Tax=Paramagnetospirillum magnetotacticum MS-1 TaxID=272627 RepID=A0A0C2YPK7_PARME|nr:YeeE/YedE family protein [Paramagnetospirillum magnetotacticum]KIL97063.1 Lipocalin-related protein and Bos/Can/Equ allergen [Paramagnetospirillum magnetotacticum MS-1]